MKSFFALTVFLYFISSINQNAFSQAGNLDSTFSDNGYNLIYPGGGGWSVVVQPDGKIIVAGTNSGANFAVARFKTNGTPDSTFSSDGKISVPVGIGAQNGGSLALQADGKILVAGLCQSSNGGWDYGVFRLKTDGTIDNTFNGNGKVIIAISPLNYDDECYEIAVQTDGKIVLAGSSLYDLYTLGFSLVRLNTDGSLDNSFGTAGKVVTPFFGVDTSSATAMALAIQSDGKILLGGHSWQSGIYSWRNSFSLARYNSNGTLDMTFGNGGRDTTHMSTGGTSSLNAENDFVSAIVLQSDGKILVTGHCCFGTPQYCTIPIIRYNSNGSLDNSFGSGGKVATILPGYDGPVMYAICIQQDNKILVAGNCDSGSLGNMKFLIARYNSNGSIDSSFGVNGFVITDMDSTVDDMISGMALQQDGKIVVTGVSGYNGMVVARYLSGLNVGVVDLFVADNPLLIYPNPIYSEATLQYTLTKNEQITIELFDMQGKLVQQFITNETRLIGKHEEVLQFNELLTSGNYILSIGNGKNKQAVKLMKE